MKRCTKCGETKPESEFYRKRGGFRACCKVCFLADDKKSKALRADRERDREKQYRAVHQRHTLERERQRKGIFITANEYDAMFSDQNGRCAICGKTVGEEGKLLGVDHDHSTGRIRGLLCRRCNLALAFMDDSVDRLSNAIVYLTNASGKSVDVSIHVEKSEINQAN